MEPSNYEVSDSERKADDYEMKMNASLKSQKKPNSVLYMLRRMCKRISQDQDVRRSEERRYSPLTPVIQSSGTGKTSLAFKLAKILHTIPVVIQRYERPDQRATWGPDDACPWRMRRYHDFSAGD